MSKPTDPKEIRRQTTTPAQWPSRLAPNGDFSHMIRHLLPSARDGRCHPSPELVEEVVALAWQADPTADVFAASLAAGDDPKRARADFQLALEEGIAAVEHPSPELVRLIEEVDTVPDGIDLDRVQAGARLMRRIDPVTFWSVAKVLGFYFAAYVPNSARALADNAASLRNAVKRQIETGRYFADMVRPEGLSRFSTAGKSTVRLRVLHAHVRNFIRRQGKWDDGIYGAPLSQLDMLYASLDSTYLIAMAAAREGYAFTPDERDDLAQFGAYMAYLMGVPADALWRTSQEADERAYAFLQTSRGDCDPEARRLVLESLLSQPMPLFDNALDRGADAVSVAYARRIMGDELCDQVGSMLKPHLLARLYVPIARPLLAALDGARRRSPALDRACFRAMDRFWYEMIPALLEKHTGSRNKDFAAGAGASSVSPDRLGAVARGAELNG